MNDAKLKYFKLSIVLSTLMITAGCETIQIFESPIPVVSQCPDGEAICPSG